MEFEDRIPKLIAGYQRGDLTPNEQRELDAWINETEANKLFFAEAIEEKLLAEDLKHFNQEAPRLNKAMQSIAAEAKEANGGILVRLLKYAAAAALLVIIGGGLYYIVKDNFSGKNDIAKTTTDTATNNDITPGGDKAILIMSDQKSIILDNAQNGMIAAEKGVQVNKNNGRLNYDAASLQNNSLVYHTLVIPRKGKYQLKLPDGTEVWLNSDSKLRYPISFTGSNERKVELSGEAYFKVAKNSAQPFRVVLSPRQHGQETVVEAIGTEFNLNSYDDEPSTAATLIEGLVKVNCGSNVQMLKPNQQVVIDDAGKMHLNRDPNIDATLAWKQGYFMFESLDVPTLMRQIRRWYDVEVVYQGKIPDDRFGGKISRNRNLSDLISSLKTEGLDIKFESNKIVIRGVNL